MHWKQSTTVWLQSSVWAGSEAHTAFKVSLMSVFACEKHCNPECLSLFALQRCDLQSPSCARLHILKRAVRTRTPPSSEPVFVWFRYRCCPADRPRINHTDSACSTTQRSSTTSDKNKRRTDRRNETGFVLSGQSQSLTSVCTNVYLLIQGLQFVASDWPGVYLCVGVCVRAGVCGRLSHQSYWSNSAGGVTPPSILYALLNPRETHRVKLEDWNLPTSNSGMHAQTHTQQTHAHTLLKQLCRFFPRSLETNNIFQCLLHNLQSWFYSVSAFSFERQKSHQWVPSYPLQSYANETRESSQMWKLETTRRQ